MNGLKSIEFRIAKLTVSPTNLVTVKYKNVAPQPSIEEISELITKGIALINQQPFLLLTDLSDTYGEWDNETKIFVSNHKQLNKLKIAEAVVAEDFATKLLVTGYKLQKKGEAIVKLFNEKQEALDWLTTKI